MDSVFLRVEFLLTEKPIVMKVSKMATVLRKMRVMMMQMLTL